MTRSEKRRLYRALERRFGASIMPLQISPEAGAVDPYRYRVTDTESGAVIIATFAGPRLRVITERAGDR
jgi:hypothetical protein